MLSRSQRVSSKRFIKQKSKGGPGRPELFPVIVDRAIRIAVALGLVLACCSCALGLNPSLEMNQYAHTSWTARDGYSLGAVFAMAQTPDGYLWLGGEFGLFRFDGVRFTRWQPPVGQQLPDKPYSLLVTGDGTLWIGTFAGLVSWKDDKLTQYPEVGELFVTSV